MKTIIARATDTNHRRLGPKTIRVGFRAGVPQTVEYRDHLFTFTGKRVAHHKTGADVVELATTRDARIWVTTDATRLYEDGCILPA